MAISPGTPSSPDVTVTTNQLLRLLTAQILVLSQKVDDMSDALNTQIEALRSQVEATKSVEESAKVAFEGFAARMEAAVEAAKGQGATPEQLQAIQDEIDALNTSSGRLAAAVAANAEDPRATQLPA